MCTVTNNTEIWHELYILFISGSLYDTYVGKPHKSIFTIIYILRGN